MEHDLNLCTSLVGIIKYNNLELINIKKIITFFFGETKKIIT